MSFMWEEIRQQPEVIERLIKTTRADAAALAAEAKRRNVQFCQFAARGTSDNAATYGKYLFEIAAGLPVSLAAPSVLGIYGAKLRLENSLVIGISQSGQAADVIEYLAKARQCGALTACITNEPGSEITQVAEFTLLCQAGKERSVAATKTYTSTLGALVLLCAEMVDREDLITSLALVPDQMRITISCCDEYIDRKTERYRYADSCVVLARGVNRATAFEGALKLAETCYLKTEPYSSVDFLHGPIAIIEQGSPCFLYAAEGPSFASVVEIAERLAEKGAEMLIASTNKDIVSVAQTPFCIPIEIDELLSPLVYMLVGQMFAHALAMARGLDPDKPRGLSKVTITR